MEPAIAYSILVRAMFIFNTILIQVNSLPPIYIYIYIWIMNHIYHYRFLWKKGIVGWNLLSEILIFDQVFFIIIPSIKMTHQNNYQSPLMLTHCRWAHVHWSIRQSTINMKHKNATKKKILVNQFSYFDLQSPNKIRIGNF
jgi:hypothetical protein